MVGEQNTEQVEGVLFGRSSLHGTKFVRATRAATATVQHVPEEIVYFHHSMMRSRMLAAGLKLSLCC